MAGKNAVVGNDTLKQITHLTAALKAPRITESAARLARAMISSLVASIACPPCLCGVWVRSGSGLSRWRVRRLRKGGRPRR